MDVLIKLIVSVLVFLLARWLLGLVGVPEPINLIIAILLAVVAYVNDFAGRLR